MAKRKLPTGVQTFREVRGDDCYYVDKTRYLALLAAEGKHCLLSRPRRFGKSLFLDTARELFEGNEPLFQGLAVHDAWDWTVRHPVITLSFAAGHFDQPGLLAADLADKLARLERIAGMRAEYETVQGRFAGLVEALFARAGQRVVVLVDEYDRPIVDALDDAELAKRNRSILRGLYGVVKDCDRMIRMSFFTGVSKFSKVSLFSDPNNLTDLTLDPRFAAVCGYTERELETTFVGAGLDVVAEESASRGRADIVVRHASAVWVFELKSGGRAQDALAQIDARGCAEKYRHLGLPIHRIGVSFRDRNIAAFEVAGAD